MFFSLLGLDPGVAQVLGIVQYVIVALIALCALAIIFLVLFQKSNSDGGLNAISGVQETYFAHNKGNTREGTLRRLTMILAIVIAVLAIVYWITLKIYNPFN
ncbi:MAG: preprotein translocase subunit SecG [Clostridia bacterium]|nr:preprotein translocase subunit SecG [Clostridia bacterium]